MKNPFAKKGPRSVEAILSQFNETVVELQEREKALNLSNRLKALKEADKQILNGSTVCLTGKSGDGHKGYQLNIELDSRNIDLVAQVLSMEITKTEIQLEALGVEIEEEIPGVV